jgi:lipid-binding SYLF domain-containing protein
MKKLMSILLTIVLAGLPLTANAASVKDRLENCGTVMDEIMSVPEGIPQNLMDKAECIIVIPSVLKLAFGIGASYGRGAMTCRSGEHFDGKWGPLTMIALEGGSFGFQLGAQATDFIILVMNPRGATAILSSKVKLGVDASAAAGPKGRDAEAATDLTLRTEMLTYSRSRGLFAGLSLEGSTLRPDNGANEELYGKKISAKDIVRTNAVSMPAAAQKLTSLLDKFSPRNNSDPNSLK